MPLLRKLSEKAKKKLQHQLYLARENPELVIDIAGCELLEVPSEVFALCKVLQKETLLLHTNQLTTLDNCGPISNLLTLRILDIHSNELSHLPVDIGSLHCLQVLNIDHNKIKKLPDSIGKLHALQTLSAVDNRLTELPETLCDMRSLRTLDISQNKITHLPRRLCLVHTLESLGIDCQHIKYPSSDICSQGIEAIMRFLCAENGTEYIAPSSVLLPVLPSPTKCAAATSAHDHTDLTSTLLKYEDFKEKKRLELLQLERCLAEEQQQQALLLADATANQNKLLQIVSEEQEKLNTGLSEFQQQKDVARTQLVKMLQAAEAGTLTLVNKLLNMTERARKTEQLLDEMERDRCASEQWFRVKQEEIDNLRRKDVLVAMQQMLQESATVDGLLKQSQASREILANETQKIEMDTHGKITGFMTAKQGEHKNLFDRLVEEERLQKEAFEMLLMQRDARHSRVRGHITLVERELAQLTLLEVEQRQLRTDVHMNILAEKRLALTQLLIQLLVERDKREVELRNRMCEMEAERLANQFDYWLVQYQRLLDNKPTELAFLESQLASEVVQLLEWSGALHYVPLLARNHVTLEVLLTLTEDDFKLIGVTEASVRRALVREIARYIESHPHVTKQQSRPSSPIKAEPEGVALASANQPAPSAPVLPPSEDSTLQTTHNTECAICLNAQSTVVFLPCGHVCCCSDCAKPLAECPLCRTQITQKVRIFA